MQPARSRYSVLAARWLPIVQNAALAGQAMSDMLQVYEYFMADFLHVLILAFVSEWVFKSQNLVLANLIYWSNSYW